MTVTRDYGETANEKANELLFHLGLATISIVVLIAIAIGWREALVTLVVIPTTILLTLFAANLMGYTINRVSLFALIFSIGILVDDAIVVVENIARHWGMNDGRPRLQATIEAVAEVGNPTVVATLTVVAALLPMLFVSGLMGPYMAPIPANASAAMLFSFFVAMVVAPWLMLRLAPKDGDGCRLTRRMTKACSGASIGASRRRSSAASARAWIFLIGVGVATLLSMVLFATKSVTVKLLPFDNKSEIAVMVDLPEGASLEDTERTLFAAANIARGLPEITSVQSYAGTPAPFNFNGLVRHYYVRERPELGELQVNLAARADRKRVSHDIALDLRQRLKAVSVPAGTSIKVVEVPPGPPVLATLLAEVYGPDAATRRAVTGEIKKLFAEVPFIVDIDNSIGEKRPRLRLSIDQDRLEFFGVEQRDVYDTIQTLFGGVSIGYSHRGEDRNPIEIAVRLPKRDLAWTEALASTPVPANTLPGSKTVVELGQVVKAVTEEGSPVIFRRDGRFADMVMAELAGRFEAPLYGMLEVAKRVDAHDWGALPKPVISLHGQPADESHPTLLWDGEWEITYVTFRDMGAAFGAAILGIYVLVVAQFRSFRLPLVILTPIPLTLIGILIGHWLLGAPFTATSMIGFIALAGIIVRNSILLVDFIRHSGGQGKIAARGGAGSRRRALQADPAHRAGGDDRRRHHPARPDLPGPGDFAAVRAGVLDAAHGPRHPRHLHRAAAAVAAAILRQVRSLPHGKELFRHHQAHFRRLAEIAPGHSRYHEGLFGAGAGRDPRRRAGQEDQGTDRARDRHRNPLRRLHRLPYRGPGQARRHASGSGGDARHGRLYGRRSVADVCGGRHLRL